MNYNKILATLNRAWCVFDNKSARKAEVMGEIEERIRELPFPAKGMPVLHDDANCTRIYALSTLADEPRDYLIGGYVFVSMDGEVRLNYVTDRPRVVESWRKINAGMEYAYKLAAEKRAGVNHYELTKE